MRYKKLVAMFTCLVLVSGCQTQSGDSGSTSQNGETNSAVTAQQIFGEKTAEENRAAEELKDERKTVMRILQDYFGDQYLAEELAVTIGTVGSESKVIIHYKKGIDGEEELKRLIRSSEVSQKAAFEKMKYTPSEINSYTTKIINYLQQDESILSKVSGLDPEAVDGIIYILVNEELDQESEEQLRTIFPDIEYVKVSEETGFTEDQQ